MLENLLTTLLCVILLVELLAATLNVFDGERGSALAELAGAAFCCKVAAAAAESPTVDRTAAALERRKIDENSLLVFDEYSTFLKEIVRCQVFGREIAGW